jgi:L-asparaginase II
MVRNTMEEVTGAGTARRSRHRRLLDPDLCDPLEEPRAWFRAHGGWRRLSASRAAAAKAADGGVHGQSVLCRRHQQADTTLMEIGQGRVFTKGGAEGVHCAALPELGLGIALKCGDGAGRAAEIAMTAVLAKLLKADTGCRRN